MKSKNLFLIFSVLGTSLFLISPNDAESSPLLPSLVDENPYYFSQDNFGIDLLRVFKAPLTPYLTPGVTDKSTNEEIMNAYYKANSDLADSFIEQDSDRAISYRLHIDSPEIYKDVTSFDFQLFNPATNPYEFTLESLASKDKQFYYEFASRYINPGKRPDPFDATIDIITGDGTVLQKWRYFDCQITYFETYLQDDLFFLMFAGGLATEIRDKSEMKCRTRYLEADMDNVFNPYVNYHGKQHATKSYPTDLLYKLPTTDDRAMSFLVSFVGQDIPEEITFQTFQKFGPTGDTITTYDPQTGLSIVPQFFLESLVSKDKKAYYEYISRYINPGKIPEPFDVKVDLVAGDGTPILRWQYFHCKVTNFETFLSNALIFLKFHTPFTAEIRDKTEFECDGFHLTSQFDKTFSPYVNLQKIGQTIPITKEGKLVIPTNNDRAMSYVVHFSDGDFGETTKTIRTFSQFRQTAITEFYLKSLPSQDKNELYDLIISHTLNPGRVPAPFSVTVDLVAGDETILQKWQYYQCQVSNYQTKLSDDVLSFRYTKSFTLPEIRETIFFDCRGQNLVADPLNPISPFVNLQRPGQTTTITKESPGIVPTDEDRAISYVVHLSGTDIPQEETFTSFASFKTHGKTVTSGGSLVVYDKQRPAFYLESLPSKDKENFYMLLAKYINPGKKPFPFDVTVDMVSGDTSILQTWQYFDCQIVNYEVLLSDSWVLLKYKKFPEPEIRDTALFVCEGFHFETPRLKAFSPYASLQKLSEDIEITNETGSIVPSNNDRPMSYVVHFSNGEIIIPHTYLTFSKYKQTGTTQFWLESLPSQDKEFLYDFIIARYINPGPTPELFDVSVDLVTGDGTVLQSWQYHKCKVTDYVTYRNDDLLLTRYAGGLSYEILDKSTFDCAGVNIDIENKIPFSMHTDLFTKGLKIEPIVQKITVPPHAQLKSGTSANEIECKREMELMIRPNNALPYCVKSHRVNVLQEQGWEHISKKQTDESKTEPAILQAVLPTDDERVMSYRITAIGKEIPKEVQSIKIAKFAPFTTNDITINTAELLGIPMPENAITTKSFGFSIGNYSLSFEVKVPVEDLIPLPTASFSGDRSTLFGVVPHYQFGDKPSFYLESLPAKDQKEFFKWISRYVNPGKKPDPVDFAVELLDGSGNTVQTWMYRDCSAISYMVFLEYNIMMYKFHESWQSEIKDRAMFWCGGLHLNEV